MKTSKHKSELIREVNAACREMSTATVLFHQSLAQHVGISGADHKYLDILLRKGAMSAIRLAKYAGLTAGAITGIVDRLEKMALVKREADPKDRRKIVIAPQVERINQLFGPQLSSLIQENETFHDKYSLSELVFIKEYLENITALVTRKTRELTGE
ncbi:MarR family transcriptional regulator [Parapedobacter defluvii]|uniref:MarR family winged helix-turn-helix transcriptional regulator n=1 Tax=Parapedobacter defluvii TaxID=2045106 RepID=UPI00333FD9EA